MIDRRVSYWERTTYEVGAAIKANQALAAQLVADMEQMEARLALLPCNTRPCPWCKGSMIDLAPLIALDVQVNGSPVRTLDYERLLYHMYVPESWECQTCGAFMTTAPVAPVELWERGKLQPGDSSAAAMILTMQPDVEQVASIITPHQVGWLLKRPEGWYFLSRSRFGNLDG